VIVPFQNFPTADGWIVVACPKEKFWQLLCDAIGRPELATEFPSFGDRDRRRDELEPILEKVFRGRTSEDWLGVLAAAGVPSAPVNDVEGAVAEADIVEYEHPQLGTVRQVASPLRLSGPEPPLRRAPELGADTEQVLVELCGYEPERVRELAAEGVFGEQKGAANG
jgi:crotonobetainyl-CoA:carnitine CoA-transferase CaiB-like acyl-CoA transferase